jgi:hypothetical protein
MSFSDCLEVLARPSSPLLSIGGIRGPRLIGHFPGILDNRQNIGSADTSTQEADTKGKTSRRQTGKMSAIIACEVKWCWYSYHRQVVDVPAIHARDRTYTSCVPSVILASCRAAAVANWKVTSRPEKRASNQHSQTRKQGDVIPAF